MSAKNPKFNKNAAADKVLNFEKKKAAGKVQKRNSHLKSDGKSRKGKPRAVFEKSTQLGALGGPGCWVGDPATQHPAKF
jgi:hypothetical protein